MASTCNCGREQSQCVKGDCEHCPALDEDGHDADEEDFAGMDCGMGPTNQCQLAGTEWCDWECPYSAFDLALKRAGYVVAAKD